MKVSSSFINLVTKSVAESMDVHTMVTLAKMFIHNYDLNKRTGIPENIPIQKRDAAKQIVRDINQSNLLLHFICQLIEIKYVGLMAKKYNIIYLNKIIDEVLKLGFIFDSENKMFVEDSNVRRTRNWGTLREDEDYVFTFVRLDIVGNSKLVREYPDAIIKSTYSDLRKIVDYAIDVREGRVWNWEGDGGLIAFYFSNKYQLATLSAMEIAHELFMYNLSKCKLKKPLQVRIAVHGGLCGYTSDYEELMKNEVIKKTIEIEAKYTKPNTVTISNMVGEAIDENLLKQFVLIKGEARSNYHNYELRWEK
ncbi:hypothetical protein ACFL20_12040 [Spirochaetota bacterium]